jgi:hypothetical protein
MCRSPGAYPSPGSRDGLEARRGLREKNLAVTGRRGVAVCLPPGMAALRAVLGIGSATVAQIVAHALARGMPPTSWGAAGRRSRRPLRSFASYGKTNGWQRCPERLPGGGSLKHRSIWPWSGSTRYCQQPPRHGTDTVVQEFAGIAMEMRTEGRLQFLFSSSNVSNVGILAEYSFPTMPGRSW